MRCSTVVKIFAASCAAIVCVGWIGIANAEAARSSILSKSELSNLKAALVDSSSPYVPEMEIGPSADPSSFINSVAAWTDLTTPGSIKLAIVGSPFEDKNKGAAYVFSLEPGASQWHQEARLVPNDGAEGDSFGFSVTIDGNTVAVGSPKHSHSGDNGAVYIYTRNAVTNAWSKQGDTLLDSCYFGHSTAVSKNTLAIGSTGFGCSKVIIFDRIGDSWNHTTDLIPADITDGGAFGATLALADNLLLIGAPFDPLGKIANRGSAYIYENSAGGWSFQQKLRAGLDGAAGDLFGTSVAISGSTAVVGAPVNNDGKGAVYPFLYDADSKSWILQPTLDTSDISPSYFASSNRLAVGAPYQGSDDSGGAYVYEGSVSSTKPPTISWKLSSALTNRQSMSVERFGDSIALAGDSLLVGIAPGNPENMHVETFSVSGTNWLQGPPITPLTDAETRFGFSVAISGNTAIVAAPLEQQPSGDFGVATIMVKDSTTGIWSEQTRLPHPQRGTIDAYLYCDPVAIDGDTAVLGMPDQNSGQGTVAVYVRSGTTWTLQATLSDASGHAFDNFGCSAAISGNTILVGAPGIDSSKGGGYVFTRNAGMWSLQSRLSASDAAAGDGLGLSAAISADTAVLGAPHKSSDKGVIYVYSRSGTTWTSQQLGDSAGSASGDRFGVPVSVSGDSIAVGVTGRSGGSGRVCLYKGGDTSWTQQSIDSPDAKTNGFFGGALSLAGDRVIIGEMGSDKAYVYTRRGVTWTPYATFYGDTNTRFGGSVGLSNTTAIIGAYLDGGSGRAYVFSDKDVIFQNSFE